MFCLLVEGECQILVFKNITSKIGQYTKQMSMYSNQLEPALQNLLQCVVWFFHPRLSCTAKHISADVQRITLNASCMTISGERTEQLDIFCRVTGFMSDFLSFIDVELIRFFHESLQFSPAASSRTLFTAKLQDDYVPFSIFPGFSRMKAFLQGFPSPKIPRLLNLMTFCSLWTLRC